jgi:hypothetical protein
MSCSLVKEKPCSISKMEEPVLDVVEKSQTTPEGVIEKPERSTQPTEPVVENPPKKKGGRPAGSKDKAPRRKKIVEEPIVQELPKPEPVQPPKAEPQPKAEPKAEPQPRAPPSNPEPEPLTPRSLLRVSANHMLEAKRLAAAARKAHLGSAYTSRLAVF